MIDKLEYSGKTCIITGGAAGIGLCIAKSFSQKGSHVVIVDIDEKNGFLESNLINKNGGSSEFMKADLSHEGGSAGVIESIVSKSKCNDFILINNARAGKRNNLLDETEKNWDVTVNVGLKSAFFASQALIKNVKERNLKANICNIGSVASSMVTHESPSYHATKSGLLHITKYLAVSAGPFGVRVNCVLPGFIVQGRYYNRYWGEDNSDYRRLANIYHPLGQVGSENDVAEALLFLCSDRAKYISGVTLMIDGAATIQEQFSMLLKQSDS